MMTDSTTSYLDALSEFVCSARLEDLPDPVIERARWMFADSVAVIAAGMQVREMKDLAARMLAKSPSAGAWVIGTGRRARRYDAALLNGAAGTWFELDEGNVHASGHPGIQLLPAAIAYAQEEATSGS